MSNVQRVNDQWSSLSLVLNGTHWASDIDLLNFQPLTSVRAAAYIILLYNCSDTFLSCLHFKNLNCEIMFLPKNMYKEYNHGPRWWVLFDYLSLSLFFFFFHNLSCALFPTQKFAESCCSVRQNYTLPTPLTASFICSFPLQGMIHSQDKDERREWQQREKRKGRQTQRRKEHRITNPSLSFGAHALFSCHCHAWVLRTGS